MTSHWILRGSTRGSGSCRSASDSRATASPSSSSAIPPRDGRPPARARRARGRRVTPAQQDVLRRDLDGAGRSARGAPARSEQPVVRADEHSARPRSRRRGRGRGRRSGRRRRARRLFGDVGQRVGQQHRARRDVQRTDAVREIDDRAGRRDPVDNGVAHADPLVPVAEVGQEDDRARHRPPSFVARPPARNPALVQRPPAEFNRLVLGPERLLSPLAAALRNADVRRVELAWGAAIAAEWAHFVALGVFAYDAGGAAGVGVAGLVRLLPAAIVAPFAASLGDRFRRERFLLAMALLGAVALAVSAAAAFAGSDALVFALAAVVGLSATLIRPALQALLPSLARTPRGADRGQRRHVDDREHRDACRSDRGRRARLAVGRGAVFVLGGLRPGRRRGAPGPRARRRKGRAACPRPGIAPRACSSPASGRSREPGPGCSSGSSSPRPSSAAA